MSEWISVKQKLPDEGQIMVVKICGLFPAITTVMYTKKYFVVQGENITKWVTHWRSETEEEKNDWMDKHT